MSQKFTSCSQSDLSNDIFIKLQWQKHLAKWLRKADGKCFLQLKKQYIIKTINNLL